MTDHRQRHQVDQWMMQALEARRQRNAARALRLLGQVLDLQRDFGPALHLAGLVQLENQHSAEALPLLERAAQLAPDNSDCLYALGVCQADLNRDEAAAASFRRAFDLQPSNLDALMNLALTLERLGEPDAARERYRQLVAVAPTRAEAWARLGVLAEASSELEEAAHSTARALQIEPGNIVANLTQAQLDARTNAHEAAAERLEQLLAQSLSPVNEAVAAGRLGRALDLLGDYNRAFRACDRANQALLRGYGNLPPSQNAYSFEAIALLKAFFSNDYRIAPASKEDLAASPVFLVGFPRSGTTLLDRILAAHPRIAVLEERDALAPITRDFVRDRTTLERLNRLSAAEIESYRTIYLQNVAALRDAHSEPCVVIDKLPLNAILIGVIRHFFPQARFILALRDPRDICLSCFMQSFGMNESMRYMLDLDSIGSYYGAVMDLVECYETRLPLRLFAIRYEDVINDMPQALRPLLGFLDQSWDDAMLQYRDKLRSQHIGTPSYHQVIQPLYRNAIGRWQHYSEQLGPILPLLAPYVQRFGYAR